MRQAILFFWRFVDPMYFSFTRLKYIKYGENIFRVRITTYKGYELTLSDGTQIKKNDTLLKIHLHNAKLLTDLIAVDDDFQKAKAFYHSIKKSLPDLASYLYHHPKRDQIKAIIGITSLKLNRNRVGFEVYEIKNTFYKRIKSIALLPINLMSSGILGKGHFEPAYIFMAKEVLLNKHLPAFNEETPLKQEPISIDQHVMI